MGEASGVDADGITEVVGVGVTTTFFTLCIFLRFFIRKCLNKNKAMNNCLSFGETGSNGVCT